MAREGKMGGYRKIRGGGNCFQMQKNDLKNNWSSRVRVKVDKIK